MTIFKNETIENLFSRIIGEEKHENIDKEVTTSIFSYLKNTSKSINLDMAFILDEDFDELNRLKFFLDDKINTLENSNKDNFCRISISDDLYSYIVPIDNTDVISKLINLHLSHYIENSNKLDDFNFKTETLSIIDRDLIHYDLIDNLSECDDIYFH